MKRFACSALAGFALLVCSLGWASTVPMSGVPEGLECSDWQSIQAVWQAGQHAVHADREQPGTWTASNAGQQWTTRFDGRGFDTQPAAASWRWGLELQRWGLVGAEQPVPTTATVHPDGQRIHYRWSGALDEWYVNDSRGLEHGYTVHQRPQGSGDQLRFELSVRGDLQARIGDDGQAVHFVDAQGITALNYSALKVWDADGTPLAATFEPLTDGLALAVNTAHARYPITIDPLAQQAYLKASNTGVSDYFGNSVAVSGDTVVVGASWEDSSTTGVNTVPNEGAPYSGAVYVFVRSGGGWSQQAYLKASNTGANDYFGTSVAVFGDTVVVGASGEDSSTSGVNSTPNELASDSGAAYVFVRSAGVWSQQAYLKASNTGAGDYFGSVAVSGDTVMVGANGEDSSTTGVNSAPDEGATFSGAAYVFVRSAGVWSQQAYLKASNTGAYDQFGGSVAVAGDTVVVGAYLEDSSTIGVDSTPNEGSMQSGAAYVFVRSGGVWSQQAYLKASNTGAGDLFGGSVAVSGDTVVVGARNEDSSTTGVNSTPNEGAINSGAAYVFIRSAGAWSQQAYLKASNTGAGDNFGSVAVSGDTVVVGAWDEDSSTTGVNSTPNEGASDSGAAYVFDLPSFTVGGNVSGLAPSNSVVLQNNGGNDLMVNADGSFTFATALTDGSAYTVTVQTQPTSPNQTCTVTNGSGTLAGSNITNVSVACTTNTYTVGGSVSGLAVGNSVVLQNNGGDALTVSANGSFSFSTPVNDGDTYAVTVSTQPTSPNQTCRVSNGSGTLAGSNITNVSVACTTNTYTVGGSVSGLTAGNSVVLQKNGGDDLTVSANGNFSFATALTDGSSYAVAVSTQPTTPIQQCTVSNGSGTVAGAEVSSVVITCVSGVISVSRTALTFVVEQLGDVATPQTISVTSSGPVPLEVKTVSIGGAQADHFSIVSNTCDNATLASGHSCEIQIDYAPSTASGSTADLMIPSSDAGGTSIVELSGMVTRIFADGFE